MPAQHEQLGVLPGGCRGGPCTQGVCKGTMGTIQAGRNLAPPCHCCSACCALSKALEASRSRPWDYVEGTASSGKRVHPASLLPYVGTANSGWGRAQAFQDQLTGCL